MATTNDRLARLSCSVCRKQKRKCSRELPSCQLCRKNKRPCEYSAEAYGSDEDGLRLSGTTEHRNQFPKLFFLDSYIFGRRQCLVPRPSNDVPSEFVDLVVNGEMGMWNLIENYFISKLRVLHQLSSSPSSIDMVLLTACMQLFFLSSTAEDQNSIATSHHQYQKTKRLASHLECSGQISLRLLQAHMLLSLYELLHAIHPSAYLTIGHSARLAHALGLHDRCHATNMLGHSFSWTETEEHRRICWALLVLDRYVNIGLSGRPIAWQDAKPDDLLPQDEDAWESGGQTVSQALAVSAVVYTGPKIRVSPFARTCQVADLLSRVLKHVNQHPSGLEMAVWYQDAIRVHHILRSFGAALGDEFRRLLLDDDDMDMDSNEGDSAHDANDAKTQKQKHLSSLQGALGICYSAQIALYDMHTCAEGDAPEGRGIPEQLECQTIALANIASTCEAVHQFALGIQRRASSGVAIIMVSPFVVDCLYAAAMHYLLFWKDSLKSELVEPLLDISGTLVVVGQRWNFANEYVSIIEGEGLETIPAWSASPDI